MGEYDDVLRALDEKQNLPQQSAPAAPNDYSLVLKQLDQNQLLSDNPGIRGGLKEFFRMAGQGAIRGLAEDLGMPVDNLNAVSRFVGDDPGLANRIMSTPGVGMLAGGPLAIGAVKHALMPDDISIGSTKSIRGLLEAAGVPTQSAEEEGSTSSAAHWGSEIGEFFGANLPFAVLGGAGPKGAGYVPEIMEALRPAQFKAAASKIGLNPSTWKEAAKELGPAGHFLTELAYGGLGPGTGAVLGREVGGEDHGDTGRELGAAAGNIRLGLIKLGIAGSKAGYSWFHDFLGFGTGAKGTSGKALALATQDLPSAIENIAKEKERLGKLVPGLDAPIVMPDGRILPAGPMATDVVSADAGLIAFRKHLEQLDRKISGDYRTMFEEGQSRALDHALMFPEGAEGQHPEVVKATLENRRMWLQEQMNHRVMQATALANEAQEAAFRGVELTPERVNLGKADAAASLKTELRAADLDASLTVDKIWEGVDKSHQRNMDPFYGVLNQLRAEAAASAQDRTRFPTKVFNKFFDHEGEPIFGAGTTLKQVIELDSSITNEIRAVSRGAGEKDYVYLSGLRRMSKALNQIKRQAAPGEDITRLQDALNATKSYHDTFHRGPVGRVLGFASDSGPAVPDGATIRQFLANGEKGVNSFDALMRAAQARTGQKVPLNEQSIRQLLAPYLRQEFHDTVMRGPNGDQFSVPYAQRWMKNHASPMQHFPELAEEFNRAIRTQGESIQAAEQVKKTADQLNRQAASLYLDNKPGPMLNGALDASDQFGSMRQLLAATSFDTTGSANKGIAQMVLNRMVGDAVIRSGRMVDRQEIDGMKVWDFFINHRGAFRALEEKIPGIMDRAESIANSFRFLNRYRSGVTMPTSEQAVGGGMIRNIIARVMGANLMAKFGSGEGASLQTAAIGSSIFKTLAQAITPDKSIELIRQALVDKQLFLDLTKNWNKASLPQQREAVKRLAPYFYSNLVPLEQYRINPQGTDPNGRR